MTCADVQDYYYLFDYQFYLQVTSTGGYNNNFAVIPLTAFAQTLQDPIDYTYYCNIAVKEVSSDYIILGSLFL